MCVHRHFVAARAMGVAFAFALLASGCGKASPTSPSTGSGTLLTIFITNGVFSPNPLTIKVGQRVNWKNNDTTLHSATADGGQFNTGNIAPTSAANDPVTMNTAGTIPFHCQLHAGESGSIVVQP